MQGKEILVQNTSWTLNSRWRQPTQASENMCCCCWLFFLNETDNFIDTVHIIRLIADKSHLMRVTNALIKKDFFTQQIITCHLLLLIMAFIWSSIHKLKLCVFNRRVWPVIKHYVLRLYLIRRQAQTSSCNFEKLQSDISQHLIERKQKKYILKCVWFIQWYTNNGLRVVTVNSEGVFPVCIEKSIACTMCLTSLHRITSCNKKQCQSHL